MTSYLSYTLTETYERETKLFTVMKGVCMCIYGKAQNK